MADFTKKHYSINGKPLDPAKIKATGEELRKINAQYRELAIDVGLAAGGAIPGVGWGADTIALGRSISKGDWWGAAFDLVGFVPIVGDAAKGGRLGVKAAKVMRAVGELTAGLGKVFNKTSKAATEFWSAGKAARLKKYQSKLDEVLASCKNKELCRAKLDEAALAKGRQYNNTPKSGKRGKWDPPDGRGDGLWKPTDPKTQKLLKAKGMDGVPYKNGFPDLTKFSHQDVKIPMTGSQGRKGADFLNAEDQMKKLTENDDWTTPDNMTWHHKEDGVTMQLVPKAIHNSNKSGSSHAGGAALFNDKEIGSDF